MDLLLAGYGSSDDEDETQKEEGQTEDSARSASTSTKPSAALFSKLPPPSSTSSTSSALFSRLPQPSSSASSTTSDDSKGKGKRTVSLMLPISKEALRGKYEDEFMRQSGPALPEAPKPSGLSALLPAPKNPNPAKRQRLATPAAVVRRQMEQTEDKSETTTSTTTETAAGGPKPAAPSTTGSEAQGATARQPPRSLRAAPPAPSAGLSARAPQGQYQQTAAVAPSPAPTPAPAEYAVAGSYEAAAYGAYPGYEGYYQYGYQMQGAYPGYDYSQQQAQPQASLGDLPEPPPEFTREWEHLTKGAKIVDVSQAQITDKSGWSKEFIQENLAKATSSVSAKDRPMGMQKRKHQITALAYEAKQREMELLNQRANARKTKSETWGKYGW